MMAVPPVYKSSDEVHFLERYLGFQGIVTQAECETRG
jgi:hypothetical protein